MPPDSGAPGSGTAQVSRPAPDAAGTNQLGAETLLQEGEIDLAITELEGRSPSGIQSSILLELPLAFMVPKDSPSRKATEILKRIQLREVLIALPADEAITRLFQKSFAKSGIDFTPGIEVSSLELMKTYVSGGFGIGLTVAAPESNADATVRTLPIAALPKLVLGALWIGKLPAIAQSFLDEVKQRGAAVGKRRRATGGSGKLSGR